MHAKLHMFFRQLNLWGVWEETYDHEIATFTASETVPGVGRVLLVLVGSGRNFLGRPNPKTSAALRTPSDAMGLYDIVNWCLEAEEDPILSNDVLRRELEYLGDKDEEGGGFKRLRPSSLLKGRSDPCSASTFSSSQIGSLTGWT